MKKKGFTLIELLAVIVILAIIALIATPAVLNIIEDSRKSSAEASARNIVNAAKTYYMSETMNGRTPGNIDLSGTTLKYDGDQATKGTITFTDGKASGKMYVGGYCVEVAVDGKVESEKMDEEDCMSKESKPEVTPDPEPDPTPEPEPEVTYTKYNDGTPLLYDPVNNIKCIDSEVETNVNNYRSTHSAEYDGSATITGLKEGCMKWYVFLDSEDSSTVNLILDHNITNDVAWNSDSTGTTPDTVNAELQAEITNWNAAVKSTARLISASEVNQIAPTNPNWNVNGYYTWYYLHTGTTTVYTGAAGSNTYAWLFDNTYVCTQYGCNVADSESWSYWTSSFISSAYAWSVCHFGHICYGDIDDGGGVRPVITVNKSVFANN